MNDNVANIMTKDLYTLTPEASLFDAHELSKRKGVRHIPVVDSNQKLVGIVTQKNLFNKVLHMISLYDLEQFDRLEKDTSIKEVMEIDCATVSPETSLFEVISIFKGSAHGCLPVVDADMTLKGIVTSADFVGFCGKLLATSKSS